MRSTSALLLVLCLAAGAAAAPSGAAPSDVPSADALDLDAAAAPPGDETTSATATTATEATVDYGLVALHTEDGELVREVAIAPVDVASVGAVDRDPQTGRYFVPVTLAERGAENFTAAALAAGFGDGGTCRYDERPDDPGECLLTVAGGEVIFSAGMEPELGRSIERGEFAEDPQFVLNANNESTAKRVRAALADGLTTTPDDETTASPRTGPTPAPVEAVEYGLVVAHDEDGKLVSEVVAGPEDIAAVGAVDRETPPGEHYVPVTLTERGAEQFTEAALDAGFADGGSCQYEQLPEAPGECLLIVADGEVVHSMGIQPDFGRSIERGDFADRREFVVLAENKSRAERVRAALTGETVPTATPSTDDEGGLSGLGAPAAVVALAVALVASAARRRRR
jgi:hypothetical protein